MSTIEQKALALAEDLETEYWADQKICEAADHIRRLSAENEALRAQSDSFEFKLAELVDLVSPGLDSGDLLNDAAAAGVQATALRAQVEALTGKPKETNLHDTNAGIEVMAYLRESRAPHHIYSKMSACLFGDPDRTEAHPTPSPLTRPAVPEELAGLFREALAWGKVWGQRLAGNLWDEMREEMVLEFTRRAAAPQPPGEVARPAVPEGWKPSHQELYAMSKDAGQLTVMPPLEWLICFSARVLAAAPQPEAQPTEVSQKGGA